MLYILYFILLLAAEMAYFRVANHFNIIDKPNERSSHTQVTLRGGGVIFWVGVSLFFMVSGGAYPWFFAGLTLIAAISFADDVVPQPPKIRLLLQFVAMLSMFYEWQMLALPWYFTLLALVVCTGILNAFNFMDGINGMIGVYSLVVAASLWYINHYVTVFVDVQLIEIVMLSLGVFVFFNFRSKAKCFAGDVGSISIAFILVFLVGLLILKTQDFSYIVLLLVYGVDTVLTIVHRLWLKENITIAHRKHLYQLLANELKLRHVSVSALYALLQMLVFVGFVMVENRVLYLVSATAMLSIVYIAIKIKYFHLHKG